MASPSSSHRHLHSWRGARPAPGRPSSARWIATFVVIALLLLLGWLLWLLLPSRLPQLHFVAITTGEAHKFTVPPIPFADEDLARFAQTTASFYRFHDFGRFQEASNIRDLGQSLQGLSMEEKDVLVVYVSAHGVSDGGTAYLLCRDYDLRAKDAGRYAVTELLNQLKQSSARTKLLVLDVGWILADARLGIAVNEFPVLLADDVARHDDPDLWVLLSSSLLQSPTVLYAEQQTLFGRSFADGLLGAADLWDRGGDENGFVSLDELFTFVAFDCRRQAAGGQTPVLLQSGQRFDQLTQVPRGIQLARADLQSTSARKRAATVEQNASEAPPAKTKKKTAAPTEENRVGVGERAANAEKEKPTQEGGGLSGTGEDASPAGEAGVGEEIARAGSSAKPVTVDRPGARQDDQNNDISLPSLLHQAWQLRDRLEALPETTGQWSPMEYASQEWRELNALLLDIDLRSRAGAAFDQTRLRGQLQSHLDSLQRLERNDWIHPPTADRSLVVYRLLTSASRFAGSPEQATFTTESRELKEVGQAVRYVDRLSYRLPDYLHCHGEMVVRWADNSHLTDLAALLERLAEDLLRFQDELRAREGQRLVVSSADDSLVVLARSLRETDNSIRKLLQTQIDFLAANADQPANRDRIVGLLLTPFCSAAQRQQLVTCLDQPLKPARQVPPDTALFPQRWYVSNRQWERILQQVRLQARLFELAGVSEVAAIEPQLVAFDAATRSTKGNDGRTWPEARALGKTWESLCLALRSRVEQEGETATARWLDARDVSLLATSEQRDYFPQLRLMPPRQPDRLDVVQQPPGSLRIDADQVTVEIQVRPGNLDVRLVSITPEFDEIKLRIQQADVGQPLRPGRPVPLQLGADGLARLRLQIKTAAGLAEEIEGGQYAIELRVQAGTQTATHTIQCAVPKPNEVDLFVERIEPFERARRFGRNGTELRPPVNRRTYFRFLLANLSGQDKQVNVELYRIPDSDWAPGRLVDEYGEPFVELRGWLFQTGTDRLLPGVEPVAKTTQPVDLPADARPREVDMSPSPPPPPEPAAGTLTPAEPPPPKALPPTPPPGAEITHGLACVITNIDNPSERWVKWIEINPLTPREYLEPQVTYDPSLGQISIEIRGFDTNGDGQPDRLPSLAALAKQPIEIVWDTAGVVEPGAERNDRALIDRPDVVARLNARVASHPTRTAVIRLNVDGYPRAFVYELALNHANKGQDVRRDERSIRMTSLQMRDDNRVFLAKRREAVLAREPSDAKTEILYLQPGTPAAFAVPAKGDAILIGCEVDAPFDAFSFRDRNDVIEIGLTRAGSPPVRLYSDRFMQAWLEEVTSEGIAVSSRVGDYVEEHAVPLDIAGLKNARVRIQARLEVDQDDPPPHELEIDLDGEPPVLASFTAPAAVRQGQSVSVSVEVNDLSGPAKAEFALVKRRNDELKEDQATVRDQFSGTADRWPIAVSLDSARHEPGECFVKVRVTDRVGKQSEVLAPLTILPPLPPEKEKREPLVGTIHGVVRFGPKFTPDRITVRIKGSPIAPATTANGGRFSFARVPAGKYTLEARGPVKGYIKQGKAEIELEKKEDYAREIAIDLSDPAN